MALRACCSASSNLFLLAVLHAFSNSLIACEGTFNLVAVTELARRSERFQGKHFSSSIVKVKLTVEPFVLTGDIPFRAYMFTVAETYFCACNGVPNAAMAKRPNSHCFHLRAPDKLARPLIAPLLYACN